MVRARIALALALTLIPLSGARAADLLIDGKASASVAQGLVAHATLSGPPGALAWLLVDTSPGPTMVLGHSLPVGFTPGMIIQFLGSLPPSGVLDLSGVMPFDLALLDLDAWLVAGLQVAPGPAGIQWTAGAHLHIADRDLQLAGNPLAVYPWFETPRAFNANAPVSVAVDPLRHPEAAGITADVYVVSKKSRAQWLGDDSLQDVSGAPDTVTFSADAIQASIFPISLPGMLDFDAGLGIGVGYDVVVDLDRNGRWNGADLIDGFSDEAGFYNVHDLTQAGPLAVTEVIYTGGTWLGQDLYYPSDIANMPGLLPLVIVSHGNGHNYQWYDHIGNQLASYGFVVMSHQNNTQPGVEAASTTTLTNTDYLLNNLDTIAGGALLGHLDTHRIMWIGHSRGGEGVARAFDRVFDGTYLPSKFTTADIKLISSMAPTDFLGTANSHPHGVPYHVWVGGADNDVSGCASTDIVQSYQLLGRAEGTRLATGLNGVGHGDFHDGGGGSVAAGPCLVGRPDTHTILRAHFLALAEHFLEGNLPSEDFLWRQWEHFRPMGAPDGNPCIVVNLQYRPTPVGQDTFVLDDFQSNPALDTSSSGGAVSGTVTLVAEGRLDDEDLAFTTPMNFNGFTEANATDTTRGLVLQYDGSANVDLSFDLPAAQHDVSRFAFLTFRAAQVTRHPLNVAALQDTTFRVELRDGAGHVAGASIGAWGGGIEEPYQRTGCGTGSAGWGNEFETIRIRLTDLQHDGTELDLTDVTSVTFRFGPSFSSPASGRLGFDDLMFTGE